MENTVVRGKKKYFTNPARNKICCLLEQPTFFKTSVMTSGDDGNLHVNTLNTPDSRGHKIPSSSPSSLRSSPSYDGLCVAHSSHSRIGNDCSATRNFLHMSPRRSLPVLCSTIQQRSSYGRQLLRCRRRLCAQVHRPVLWLPSCGTTQPPQPQWYGRRLLR